jgi:hypothetical protein
VVCAGEIAVIEDQLAFALEAFYAEGAGFSGNESVE